LPQPCLAMTSDFKGGLILLWRKKSRDYVSICAELTVIRTMTTLWHTHLTTCLDYGLELLFLVDVMLTNAILAQSNKLSMTSPGIFQKIVFCIISYKTYAPFRFL